MADIPADEMRAMLLANDKLLKALITLLALRDEHLLPEMRIIFAGAGKVHNPIGEGEAKTWAHVRKELAMIVGLVDTMAEQERLALAEGLEVH